MTQDDVIMIDDHGLHKVYECSLWYQLNHDESGPSFVQGVAVCAFVLLWRRLFRRKKSSVRVPKVQRCVSVQNVLGAQRCKRNVAVSIGTLKETLKAAAHSRLAVSELRMIYPTDTGEVGVRGAGQASSNSAGYVIDSRRGIPRVHECAAAFGWSDSAETRSGVRGCLPSLLRSDVA